MRYLIIGRGGREHAIVRALTLSPTVTEIHCAPGSDGISREAICHDVDLADAAAVEAFVRRYRFDVVIVAGDPGAGDDLIDRLRILGLPVFGVSRAGVAFTKSADVARATGPTSEGEWLAVSALVCGGRFEILPAVRGAAAAVVAPYAVPTEERERISAELIAPTVRDLVRADDAFRGVLTFDVALLPGGPALVNLRAGWGESEAQVLLPLLEGDWAYVFREVALGRHAPLRWSSRHYAAVVATAPGTRAQPVRGATIDGDLGHQTSTSYVLHAGTKKSGSGQWVVDERHVIDAVGSGSSVDEAVRVAEAQARRVSWKGWGNGSGDRA